MDRSATARWAARRIAEVLHQFAAEQGWRHDDPRPGQPLTTSAGSYFLRIRVNEGWLRIRVEFVSSAFDRDHYQDWFAKVQGRLSSRLADDPALVSAITLVLLTPEEYERWGGGGPSVNTTEIDLDPIDAAPTLSGPTPAPSP